MDFGAFTESDAAARGAAKQAGVATARRIPTARFGPAVAKALDRLLAAKG